MKKVLTYSLVFLLFISCKKENAFDCFKSNGKDVTETRSPGKFESIEVFDKIDVLIEQGTEYKVEITAGKHIIKNITAKVDAGVLKIDNANKCNFVRGYKRIVKVKITVPVVDQVTNYGVGPIVFSENFSQDDIFIKAENSGDTYINGNFGQIRTSSHGNGDMYLNGTAKRLMVYTNGLNFTFASGLKVSDYIYISTYSSGDVFLDGKGLGQLDYLIWSDGNIYYKEVPAVIKNLSQVEAKGTALQKD